MIAGWGKNPVDKMYENAYETCYSFGPSGGLFVSGEA